MELPVRCPSCGAFLSKGRENMMERRLVMTMRRFAAVGMIALTVASSGCSAFRASTQMMNVTCSEQDAILTINGQRYTPPAQVNVKRNRDVAIQAYKDGFVPYQHTVGHHLNGTAALDAAGTFFFIVPGIGLFCPGAWSLDETDVFIMLSEKND
jgi:hypothetical protein